MIFMILTGNYTADSLDLCRNSSIQFRMDYENCSKILNSSSRCACIVSNIRPVNFSACKVSVINDIHDTIKAVRDECITVNRECKRANNESIEAISTCQCPSSSLPASSESPSPASARLQIKPFLSGSAMSLKKGEQDVRKPRSLRNNKVLKAKGNDQKLRSKYNQDTKKKTKGHKQNIKSNQRKRRVQIRKRKLKQKDKKRKETSENKVQRKERR